METKKSYAEQMMKKIKEQQESETIDYFNVENNVEDGYVIVKYAKEELEEKPLMNDKITMLFPKTYDLMEPEVVLSKYPDEDRPEFIYTNHDTTVNFTFSLEEGEVTDNEVEEIKDMIKKEMQRLYTGTKVEDDEMLETFEQKKISIFAMEIPTLDGNVYQATFFMALKDGLLIGAFNCNVYDKKEWKPILKQLLATIKEKGVEGKK